ncbi:hypothetical protein ACZ91_67435, partial [Streptomyces regensis]
MYKRQLEDGSASTQAASALPGGRSLRVAGVSWAQDDSLPGSKALPVLAGSATEFPTLSGDIPAPAGASTAWSVHWAYRIDSKPSAFQTCMRILSTGTVREWRIDFRTDTIFPRVRVQGFDAEGELTVESTGDAIPLYGVWNSVIFRCTQNGSSVS